MSLTFLIAPVRGHAARRYEDIVKQLERDGWTVYWPALDTNQDDRIGLEICKANRSAIERADCVHVIWDGQSQGSLFDLGMAFALRKPVHVIDVPRRTETKSFQNLMLALDATRGSQGHDKPAKSPSRRRRLA